MSIVVDNVLHDLTTAGVAAETALHPATSEAAVINAMPAVTLSVRIAARRYHCPPTER